VPDARIRLPPSPRLGKGGAYAVALLAPLLVLGAQLLLRPAIYATPFVLFFLAVAVASWVGGLRPGLLSMALSAVAGDYFFLEPWGNFSTSGSALLGVGLFVAVGSLLCLLNASLRTHDLERERLLARANEAVALRDDFLGVASHELRTPLTSLRLQLRGLERSVPEGSREHGRVAAAERSVLRLQALVESLLDVSRLSAGRLELSLSQADLGRLVQEALERLAPLFGAAGSPVHFHAPEPPVLGMWDVPRLEQVLVNLLSNAAKYGAGKPVHVAVREEAGRAWLTVQDEGIGIAPEVLPRLFGRFERGVSSRHYGGLGLGLYISRQLVEAMGGHIAVASAPDRGATFTVTLPLGQLAATGSHSVLAGG
jgi:signal transduction histidine kinase